MVSNNKVYNIIFPIFMMLLFPPFWIVVIPINYLIDYIVVYLSMKYLQISDIKEKTKKVILKVWLFGFLSDIIGSMILLNTGNLSKILNIDSQYWYEYIYNNIAYSPTKNIYSFLIVSLSIFISGLFIYFFNYKLSLNNIDISPRDKKKLALLIAIFTSPYIFLINTPM